MKPDERSKALLIAEGGTPWRTEVWNQFAHKKYDLFRIADYVCLFPERQGVSGYQICGEDFTPHLHDLLHDELKAPMLKLWMECGNPFWIHSWVKRGERGKRKLWECRKWKAIQSPTGVVSFEKENDPKQSSNGDIETDSEGAD